MQKPQASPSRCKTGSMRITPNAVNTREGERDIRREEGREGDVGKEVGQERGKEG